MSDLANFNATQSSSEPRLDRDADSRSTRGRGDLPLDIVDAAVMAALEVASHRFRLGDPNDDDGAPVLMSTRRGISSSRHLILPSDTTAIEVDEPPSTTSTRRPSERCDSYGGDTMPDTPHRAPTICSVRVGVHGGIGMVGNIGCAQRISYTVIGDVVNVAARLESLGKSVHCYPMVLVSSALASKLNPRFAVRRLGPTALIGRHRPIDVTQAIGFLSNGGRIGGRGGGTEVRSPMALERSTPTTHAHVAPSNATPRADALVADIGELTSAFPTLNVSVPLQEALFINNSIFTDFLHLGIGLLTLPTSSEGSSAGGTPNSGREATTGTLTPQDPSDMSPRVNLPGYVHINEDESHDATTVVPSRGGHEQRDELYATSFSEDINNNIPSTTTSDPITTTTASDLGAGGGGRGAAGGGGHPPHALLQQQLARVPTGEYAKPLTDALTQLAALLHRACQFDQSVEEAQWESFFDLSEVTQVILNGTVSMTSK